MKGHVRFVIAVLVAAPALVFAACGGAGGDNDDAGSVSAPGETASRNAETVGASGGSVSDKPGNGGAISDGSAPGNSSAGMAAALDRKIVFSAAMSLRADDVSASFAAVSRAARDAGGFVESSSFSNEGDDADRRSARLSLRVPVQQYEGVLATLRGLPGVTVNSENAQSTEVTDQYTDLQSRLRNLERQETQYLDLLGKAATIQDILTVTEKLDGVRLSIEQIQGRLAVLDDLTELASIDVALSPVAGNADNDGPKSFMEAFADAWAGSVEVVRELANMGAVLLVAAVWLAVPALAVLGAMRWARRNRQAPAV